MSEKKWSCKWRHCGHHGRRNSCDNSSGFPRNQINKYEGTHLGMRERIRGRGREKDTVYDYHYAYLDRRYVLGLLKHYVNKPFYKFKEEFDKKIKHIKHKLRYLDLDRYIAFEKPIPNYWRPEYYVDDNGLVKKSPYKRKRQKTLTNKQWSFNKRVKLPDFGQIREKVDNEAKKRWGTYTDTGMFDIPLKHQRPKLLGTFWINYCNRIFKAPVYTCNSELMIEYSRYNGYNWVNGNREYTPFHLRKTWKILPDEVKKSKRIEEEWIPISVWGLPSGQGHMMRLPNEEKRKIKRLIEYHEKKLSSCTDPFEVRWLQKEIANHKESLENMPDEKLYDMGYGKFYTFMKRKDYERLFETKTS